MSLPALAGATAAAATLVAGSAATRRSDAGSASARGFADLLARDDTPAGRAPDRSARIAGSGSAAADTADTGRVADRAAGADTREPPGRSAGDATGDAGQAAAREPGSDASRAAARKAARDTDAARHVVREAVDRDPPRGDAVEASPRNRGRDEDSDSGTDTDADADDDTGFQGSSSVRAADFDWLNLLSGARPAEAAATDAGAMGSPGTQASAATDPGTLAGLERFATPLAASAPALPGPEPGSEPGSEPARSGVALATGLQTVSARTPLPAAGASGTAATSAAPAPAGNGAGAALAGGAASAMSGTAAGATVADAAFDSTVDPAADPAADPAVDPAAGPAVDPAAGVATAADPAVTLPASAPVPTSVHTAAAATAPLHDPRAALPTASTAELADGLHERIVWMADAQATQGPQQARITLHPAEWGSVHIRVDLGGDGRATVAFDFETPQARHAVESSLGQLRELWAAQGGPAGTPRFEFSGGFGQAPSQQNPEPRPMAPTHERPGADDEPRAVLASAPLRTRLGLLDQFA